MQLAFVACFGRVVGLMPNWLVKLTPTGCACWYPPLRSGAAYRATRASPSVKQWLTQARAASQHQSTKHNADADQASKGKDNKVRTGQTTNGHERGNSHAADPDARRTRATHSLAGTHPCAAHELNGHCPRRSNLLSSTLALTRRKNHLGLLG